MTAMTKFHLLLAGVALCGASILSAQNTYYAADFTNEGDGFPDHTTDTPPEAGPQSVDGGSATSPEGRWTASYESDPLTDGSANEFSVNEGVLRIQDWGGEARWESFPIDVSGVDSVQITALGAALGEPQNAGSEFFEYFYTLDGGAEEATPVSPSGEGEPVNSAIVVDVAGVDSMTVGFAFNLNGGGDGYEISSIEVTDPIADEQPPAITVLAPADDAVAVVRNVRLSVSFDEEVVAGTGDIVLTDLTDGSSTVSLPVAGPAVTISGSELTIELDAVLDADTDYSVRIAAGAVEDSSGNAFAGIADDETWNFTTGAVEGAGPGDIVITEIMQNPSAVNDSEGEWFELYNATGMELDINGWTISDEGSDEHVIDNGGPLMVPAMGYIVLGVNGDIGANGGVEVDYVYAGFFLANGDDEIILTTPEEVVIDRVAYDGGGSFPDPNGASMALSESELAGDNALGENWFESAVAYGAGDFGTPGAANGESLGGGGRFGEWAVANGIPADPNDNSDGDSFLAIEEFGLGLNPTVADSLDPLADSTPSTLVVSYPKGFEAVDSGEVTYIIETSPDLSDPWTPVTADETSNRISYVFPSGQSQFARLRMEFN